MREIVLDTETTGLDPAFGHRIVEIGAVEIVNKVITGGKFHTYVNPERDMPQEAFRIHGISQSFLKDKPLFKDVEKEFIEFIGDSKLVIHNAAFDMKFLNYELSLIKKASLDMNRAIDTLAIARKMFPGARVNLDALCKRYKVDNSSRKYHGALKDAKLLAEVYVEMSGGRQTKFNFKEEQNGKKEVEYKSNDGHTITTKIVYPTEEEIKAHKELLQKIVNPLWKS